MSKLQEIKSNLPDVKNVCVSISGGLDSTTLTHLLVNHYGKEHVYAISFFYGQKQKYELELANKTCTHLGISHQILDINFLGDIVKKVSSNISGSQLNTPTIKEVLGDPSPTTYVPNRNMILLSIVLAYAEANVCQAVFGGFQAVDVYSYWDTSTEFMERINAVIELNRKNSIKIYAPFNELYKTDEILIGHDLGVNYADTISCYNPDELNRSCGECPTCSERIKAFKTIGHIDPTEYSKKINW